jgi:hypothetical protein
VQRHIRDPGAIASWGVYTGPGVQSYGTPPNDLYNSTISWDAVQQDIGGSVGIYSVTRKTYMLFGFKLISSFPGRMLNGHAHPYDQPGGWDKWCSKGVSPWAIDYWGDAKGLQYVAQAERDSTCPDGGHQETITILSQAEMEARRRQWVWLWVETVWGHNGITPDGSTRIWVAGENAPRVAKFNINTMAPNMGLLAFWTGHYRHKPILNQEASSLDMAAPRYGLTPKAAYESTPVLNRCAGATQGPGDIPGRCVQQPPVDGNVPVPIELQW